jgi:cobalt-zinc-cadmium efflux system outer membrane protein
MKRILFYLLVLATGCLGHSRLSPLGVVWAESPSLHTEAIESEPPEGTILAVEEPTGIVTLEQAVSLVILRNPELKAFSVEVRAQDARALQAGLFPNPEIEIEVENFGGEKELQDFDSSETTVQFSQLVELASKRPKRRRVATLERDLAGWDYEAKRADVLSETKQAFVDVLAAQERFSLMEELLSLAEQIFNTISERVKAGKVSPLEETRARVSYSTSLIDLERARRTLDASRKKLAALWGSGTLLFERVDGELKKITPIPSAAQLEDLISRNPDIARWTVEMEQRQEAVKLEKAGRIPDLTLSGGIRRLKETDDNAFVMGLSIPLPLFDRNQGGMREALQRQAKAAEEQRASELIVLNALAEAYQKLSTAYAEAKALQQDVLPGAQTAFDGASEGYRQGKFGYLDVLDAQRTFFEARGQYIEALASFHKSKAQVERLIGERLDAVKNTPD